MQALSESIARVCNKHGWLVDGIGGKWGEEIALAAIALPVGFSTYKAVTQDLSVLKAKAQAKEKTQADAPPAAEKDITPEPVFKTM